MAKSKKASAKRGPSEGKSDVAAASSSKPKFSYTTTPAALRRFLEMVPKKPKPDAVELKTIKSWGILDNNAATIPRVLRSVGLINADNVPTDVYTEFMKIGTGPSVLGGKIREAYKPLFAQSHEPHKESAESVRNLFNIHSGGGERNSRQQSSPSSPPSGVSTGAAGSTIHIDLHIHLPENKSRRDYEYMFEDIAKYIFRQPTEKDENESE